METINKQLLRWFGMNIQTALQVLFIISMCVFVAMIIITAIIMLIQDPSAANNASWGFAD